MKTDGKMYVVLPENAIVDAFTKTGTLLYFTATGCEPCQELKPSLQILGKQTPGTVLEIDVDVHETIAQKYNVQSVPYLVCVRNHKVVWSHVGILSSRAILKMGFP